MKPFYRIVVALTIVALCLTGCIGQCQFFTIDSEQTVTISNPDEMGVGELLAYGLMAALLILGVCAVLAGIGGGR